MSRPPWDEYFLGIAEAVARRADCTRSRVGAVLVNSRNEVRGTGYNGSPAGLPGCLSDGACPRGKLSYDEVPADSDYANCIADHAERNALRHTRPEDLAGSTLYVTRQPCPGCTTLINACGIARVVVPPVPAKNRLECPNCRSTDSIESYDNSDGLRCHTCGSCNQQWKTLTPRSRTPPTPECEHHNRTYVGDEWECDDCATTVPKSVDCPHLDNDLRMIQMGAGVLGWKCTRCGGRFKRNFPERHAVPEAD